MKVTLVPAQIGPAGTALTVIDGVSIGFTVMVTVLLVAVVVDKQEALLVIVQVI